ncbi:MAG TPA: hypothetical protein DIU01_10935 [Flavobacterium sp.]|nr:hypothetical protein [Flavobacterium sp.]
MLSNTITNDMKLDYIKTKNREKLGEYYFQQGLSFLIDKEFEKAYEFFKESLDYITCDCSFISLIKKNILPINIFNDIENGKVNHHQYFFVKGMILSYCDKKEFTYLALESIEKYLTKENNEYGNYVKAKILLSLEKKDEALEYFKTALNLSNNSRLNYRVGRYLCEKQDESGVINLFYSFIENPSSSCCLRELHFGIKSNLQNLKTSLESVENNLVEKFISSNSWLASNAYEKTYLAQIEDIKNIKIINDFLSFLHYNKCVILNKTDDIEEIYRNKYGIDKYENFEDSFDDDNGSSFNDEYYDDNLDMDQQSPEFWDSL